MGEKKFDVCSHLKDNSAKAYKDYEQEADIIHSQLIKENVRNVAIVAKYGAGKSSVINTYLHKYRRPSCRKKDIIPNETIVFDNQKLEKPNKNKYVRISLSTFNDTHYDEHAIERSILQQLLYSRKKDSLPNSKIERTNKTSIRKTVLLSILSILFIFFGGLFALSIIVKIPLKNIFSNYGLEVVFFCITSLIFVSTLAYVIYKKMLKRFKYKDIEADFVKDDKNNDRSNVEYQSTNLINKFIDEVLYFFECIDVDLVIFEDLDRLPSTEIFTKLRELNIIINNSCKKVKKVSFLYAVKDDLFKTEEERAKFFDFILPIVPVINPKTSEIKINEMANELKKINEKISISSKLTHAISVYVPDVRILNNTFNDYIIMCNRVLLDENTPEYLQADKMFALCLYKNLFPSDYALLEENKGLIPEVIDMTELRKKILSKIDDEINNLKHKINEIDNIKMQSFDDLLGSFIVKINKMESSAYYSGSIDPFNIKTFKNLDWDSIEHPTKSGKVYFGNIRPTSSYGKSFEDIEELLIEKHKGKREQYEAELLNLEQKKKKALDLNFRGIVDEIGLDSIFKNVNSNGKYQDKIKNYLRTLINLDLIDEHFIEYTSNYQSKLLTPNDTRLIQEINAQQSEFDSKVDSLKQVLTLLDDTMFLKRNILIKSFLDNIIDIKIFSTENNDKKYDNLVKLLKGGNNSKLERRLVKYINKANETNFNLLLQVLLPNDLDFATKLIGDQEIVIERKKIIIKGMISNNASFVGINNNQVIYEFFSKLDDYLDILNDVNDASRVHDFLDCLSVNNLTLQNNQKNNHIQQYIIDKNMYEISLHNLEVILLNDENNDIFYKSNYSYVLTSDIKDYISANIEKYVKNVLLDTKISCFKEEQENMEELLKDESIDIDVRISLLDKLHIKINNLEEYQEGLYEGLLVNKLIEPNWYNIEVVYKKVEFESIKKFIVDSDRIEGYFSCNEQNHLLPNSDKLFQDIITNLNAPELEKVSKYLPVSSELGGIKSILKDDEKISIMVKDGHIKFNVSALNNLLDISQTLNEYLKKYKKEILENFDEFFKTVPQNNQQIIMSVLNCSDDIVEIKNKLIDKFQSIIDISSYPNVIAKYIVDNEISIPSKILWQFSDKNNVSSDDKKQILINSIDSIDLENEKSNLLLYLKGIDDRYHKLVDGEKITVADNLDRKLLVILKDKKILSIWKDSYRIKNIKKKIGDEL